ncbi:recombinase family protein [Candidatus Poribacteria bacterium]
MLIGYARVSTNDQNIDLQKDALEQAGCERIYVEQISGSLSSRPELAQALEMLREGDTLVVWRLDRLGRSLKHLIDQVNQLKERKIGFRSLTESIDTNTSNGKLIFHIFGAIAEFERDLIRERTKAGLAAARARGRKGGRPPLLDKRKRELTLKLYREGEHSVKEICQMMGISKTTLYSYIRKADSQ